ncbi:sulfite exporter TauE/SafE family protein [Sphingosinicella sp. LHD-64]|uniref:sulfite exporter TauE/SafE family protein n=1 Tax=Sphingosinicella sp. LHD-64 TaxID=3072139 RepID=UPI00280F86C1|nr:sulfite exporter TauE/SafE family protein [Sphingosinicella sp. LHD-64]MDQ8756523.1 sulfite exporter TauE/SafE family protein [Sphingosinicella sp. LHD-64]
MEQTTFLVLMALALVGTGVVAGILAGLLGVGGGIVMVPVLYYVFGVFDVDQDVRIHMAVGTSLAAMIPTSIRSALAHRRKGAVDMELFRSWLPAILIGAIAGSVLAPHASSEVLRAVFAGFALLVAVNMIVGNERFKLGSELPRRIWQRISATLIGGISVMMGIGGGTFTVPYLSLFGYPIHRAVATAANIGVLIAIPGAIGFCLGGIGVDERPVWSLGYASLLGFALIVPATVIATPWGVALAHKLNPKWLRLAFALFLAITGLRMAWSLIS